MKKILATIALALGCTHSTPVAQKCDIPQQPTTKVMKHNVQVKRKLHLDGRFTTEEVNAIRAAAAAWQETSGGVVEYEFVTGYKFDPSSAPPNKILLLRLTSSDPLMERLAIEEDVVSGTISIPGTIAIVFVIDRIPTLDALRTQAMRNLGSDLGIPAYRGKYPGIMNQDMEVSCLTKYDMILFCVRYVCDWKSTSYCDDTGKNRIEKL